MANKAEYGIIGAGIIGLSCAYSLAASGAKNIVVFEKENMPGLHATGKCAGGIRAQFSTPVNIELSKYSIEKFKTFSQTHQIPVDFNQHGYLFLIDNQADLTRFRTNIELQKSHGVDVSELTPQEVKEMQPHLEVEDLIAGVWCPTDGYGDPHSFLNGYATLCHRLGVQVVFESEVLDVQNSDQDLKIIKTDQGDWEVEKVLVVCGAWSSQLCRKFGINIPMEPFRRQIHVTKPFAGVKDPVPLTIDFGAGLYFHRESGGLLLGMADEHEPSSFDQSVNEEFMETIIMAGMNRVPALETAQLLTSWAGLYAITPDNHALMGRFEGPCEIYYATGYSGHGFMHAPAVGDCMAALMTEKMPPVDISALALERFAHETVVEEFNVF